MDYIVYQPGMTHAKYRKPSKVIGSGKLQLLADIGTLAATFALVLTILYI